MRRASSLLSTLLRSAPSLRITLHASPSSHPPPPPPFVTPKPSPSGLGLPRRLCVSSAPAAAPQVFAASAAAAADPEVAFEAASTIEEMRAAFTALESALPADDKRLGLACLKLGQHLDASGSGDHEKVLSIGLRALRILDASREGAGDDAAVAMALHLAGSASYELKRFNDSLGFLNRASRILSSPELSESGEFDVRPVSHAVRLLLANVKTAMGRREEALTDLHHCLELKKQILEPDSRELATSYRDLAEAHATMLDFKASLPLCLRALEIHEAKLGKNSTEVAHDRRLLGVIYTGLEQHDKALEQNELSKTILKSWGMDADLLHADLDAANIKIAVGQYDEAIVILKSAADRTERNSETRAFVHIAMAKALTNQQRPEEVKQCLGIARGILERKETVIPDKVSEAYGEMAALYEMVNEFDDATNLLKRSLMILERLPEEQHMVGTVAARIGWLMLLTGKVSHGVHYLETAAERMKETFGPKHFGVGYVYNNLGAAYMEMERPQSAAQMFALAKDIMEISLGPQHADTIAACQSLANAYSAMESYSLALEFQQRVVNAWANHGPSARYELQEARRLYEDLESKAIASVANEITEDLTAQNDKGESKLVKS